MEEPTSKSQRSAVLENVMPVVVLTGMRTMACAFFLEPTALLKDHRQNFMATALMNVKKVMVALLIVLRW